jgi:hypothetical protein
MLTDPNQGNLYAVAETLTETRFYRMKVEGNYDPSRPNWAETSTVFLWDHPQTKAGYLTRHFYSQGVSVGDTIPAWTYYTLQNYANEEGLGSLFNTSNWNIADNANVRPPMSGPVPNTQGVYFGQRTMLEKGLAESYNVSDYDVLRFWPVGRPGADGGLESFSVGTSIDIDDAVLSDWSIADAMSIIEKGPIINDDNSPWTWLYKEAWLNSRKLRPKTLPSYIDYGPIGNPEEYLYPPKPELGTWVQGGRPIGIVSWEWTSYDADNKYVHFTDHWYQNRSSSNAPGMFQNPLIFTDYLNHGEYGNGCINTEEITARQTDNTDLEGSTVAPSTNETGIFLTTQTGIVWDPLFDDDGATTRIWRSRHELEGAGCETSIELYQHRAMLLADQIWGGTYYEGGFNIENRGLAYHLASAVKWNSLGSMTEAFIGNLTDPILYGSYGRDVDGNYGPIPPLMTFEGGGEATWGNGIKNTAPYSEYEDWDTKHAELEAYYSNTSEYLICSYIDYPNNSWVKVQKPEGLIIPNGQETGMRVCPEYNVGNEIVAISKQDGTLDLVDLNAEARRLIDYREKGTLLPYHDYFPNPYIPFETSFLIPSGQHIPPYSFNCSEFTYGEHILYDNEGSMGSKGEVGSSAVGGGGEKGSVGNEGEAGAKGNLGPDGGDGEKGDKGGEGSGGETGPKGGVGSGGGVGEKGSKGEVGEEGEKGGKGSKGTEGTSANGNKGNDIITGSWGTVVGEAANYQTNVGTSSAGYMDILLGDASTTNNETTTIRFTRKHFGACVEDSSDEPKYDGFYVFSSDFID